MSMGTGCWYPTPSRAPRGSQWPPRCARRDIRGSRRRSWRSRSTPWPSATARSGAGGSRAPAATPPGREAVQFLRATLPPSSRPASIRVTSHPRLAAETVASRLAGPAPTTSTRAGAAIGRKRSGCQPRRHSSPIEGFWVQRMGAVVSSPDTHMLQPMHSRILVGAALGDLVGEEGIGDRRAGGADEIQHLLADHAHHGVGRGESAHSDHRFGGELLQPPHPLLLTPFRAEAGGDRIVLPTADHEVPDVGQFPDQPQDSLDVRRGRCPARRPARRRRCGRPPPPGPAPSRRCPRAPPAAAGPGSRASRRIRRSAGCSGGTGRTATWSGRARRTRRRCRSPPPGNGPPPPGANAAGRRCRLPSSAVTEPGRTSRRRVPGGRGPWGECGCSSWVRSSPRTPTRWLPARRACGSPPLPGREPGCPRRPTGAPRRREWDPTRGGC